MSMILFLDARIIHQLILLSKNTPHWVFPLISNCVKRKKKHSKSGFFFFTSPAHKSFSMELVTPKSKNYYGHWSQVTSEKIHPVCNYFNLPMWFVNLFMNVSCLRVREKQIVRMKDRL